MNYHEQLLNSIHTSSELLNFVGILVTVIASIYIFKKETSLSFIRERHDKLIFPLFNLLEPVLYQDLNKELLNEALQIIEKNKNIADGKLIEILYLCTSIPCHQNITQLYTYVDKAYDKSCRKLGLKTRSATYRINRHQYKSLAYFIAYCLVYILCSLLISATIMYLFLFITALMYSSFCSTTETNRTILLILAVILFTAFTKYIDKHF